MKEEYLFSKYRELTQLGQSGQAKEFETLLVQDTMNGKIAVRKKVTPEALKIYRRLQLIHHPGLVNIIESLPCEETYGYVIEEYVSGETLEALLEKEGVLSEERTIELVSQLLLIVIEIHKMNIVHRDISPKNILISTDGIVKLIDFGIARTPKESQTRDTTVLGTVGYASPEQFGFQQTDVRADIYAVGILMNVMLTGKMPNEKKYDRGRVGKIIGKCIQMDPKNRYESVEQIYKKLTGAKEEGNIHQGKSIVPGFRTGQRWKEVIAVLGYLFMVLGTGIYVSECSGTIQAFLLESLAVLLFLWVPVLLCTNFLYFDKKIWPLKAISREAAVSIRIILAFFSLYFGFMLDSYVRDVLLKIPRIS